MGTITKSIGTGALGAGSGTVSVTNGSTAVVGSGTLFLNQMKDASGFPLTFQVGTNICDVTSIADDTHLTLTAVYPGTTNGSASYTVGSRHYSTPQAWEDALPANLVTDGNSQIGELYNDSEFTYAGTGGLVVFGGETTSSTFTITLRAGTGQSFRDHASKQTNALAYDQTKGVGFRTTDHRAAGIDLNFISNVTLKGIQILAGRYGVKSLWTATGTVIEDMLVEVNQSPSVGIDGINGVARNCLVAIRTAGAGINGIEMGASGTAVNCTVVRPSTFTATGAGIAMHGVLTGGVAINCAIFGYTTSLGTNVSASSSNNASDVAITIGTSNQASVTYANQFVTITDTGRDFKTKTGANLLDNGVTDTTDLPAADDIVGTSRPQSSAWDIGAWELVVVSGLPCGAIMM